MSTIANLSTDEQREKWYPMCTDLKIIGCYAQTELGHGSDVKHLETTATFDKKTDEFVIETPTLTSTKWWPGDMGRFANHALVMAQLIIPDEDGTKNNYGVSPFIVQIRDLKTHKWMPGVKCGDMGPKFGFHGKDNGWMTLKAVRIPRNQMLQKYTAVSREGDFSIEGDVRVLYSTMMTIRCMIISGSKWSLANTLTIGLRYSVVRRQFRNISGVKEETQLIDYQTQQMKLFPLVAKCFAISISGDVVVGKYNQMMKDIKVQNF